MVHNRQLILIKTDIYDTIRILAIMLYDFSQLVVYDCLMLSIAKHLLTFDIVMVRFIRLHIGIYFLHIDWT